MKYKKILLVDDDPDDQMIFKDAFESLEATGNISIAQNGEEAMNLLDKQSRENILPELIVLDLNMPKMNGTETLRNLKQDQRYNQIPVIIYSTSVNPLEKEKCMELGAYSYIKKPISWKESIDTAQYFLNISTE